MKTIAVLLLLFLCIGITVRKFNSWTRLLIIVVVAGVVLYVTFS